MFGLTQFDSVKPSQLSQQMGLGQLVSSLFGSSGLVKRSGFVDSVKPSPLGQPG
ncbi:hypothetical protein Hanom_Chr11g01030961 [Helianthus anomalus]